MGNIKLEKDLRDKIRFAFDFILFSICLFILIFRVQRGIDFTDESWYVAEPFVVGEGSIPYTNLWSQAPGFTIPLAFFFKLFIKINGSTEGIFIFSRYLYVSWLVLIIAILFFLLRYRYNSKIPEIILLPILFLWINSIYSINYNSIGIIYLLLASTIIFSNWESSKNTENLLLGLITGIIMARSVIGTPYTLIPCIGILLILCYSKHWKRLFGYIGGGCLLAILVIGYCFLKSGVNGFINGMDCLLHDVAYFKIESYASLKSNLLYLIRFLVPCFCCLFFFTLCKLGMCKKNLHQQLETALKYISIAFLLIGLVNGFGDFKLLTSWCWFETPLLYFFSLDKNRHKLLFPTIVVFFYFSVYIFSSFANIYGFGVREYWLYIPSITSFLSIFILYICESYCKKTYTFLYTGVLIFTLIMIKHSYTFVYRDEPVGSLTYQVESGIWKGCYTTEQRAQEVVSLENEIKRITNNTDNVLFMDWCSFAYLMTNGTMCSPSSLDPMFYSYGVNDPTIMYKYFTLNQTAPNKIIYIDYGRDEHLSIHNNSWEFNLFIETNYILASHYKNSLFNMYEYELSNYN